ncbi:lactonase family protein [Novosphingobium rosa]|uniref:lactonase family protein n=1 Tax=Novosphingobium rosa TaxID=76978 RepID=UPI00082F97AD|nr:lactonase family protein [Novosphingobium rosa]
MNDQPFGTIVYIGTQGGGPDGGIHATRLDEATGRLGPVSLVAAVDRPTWVLADTGRGLLHAVSEMGNAGDRIGDVMSFRIDGASAGLTLLGKAPSGGGGPTHLALGPDGETLFVANFGGGEVAVMPISAQGVVQPVCARLVNSGSGPHRRQKGPHAHGVTLDPSAGFLLVADMGADRIFLHRYDAARRALEDAPDLHVAVPAGAGPRLLLFGKDGRFAYLLTELSAEIYVYGWDTATGRLTPQGMIRLDPPDAPGDPSAAGFTLSADGRFLYATNRRTGAIHVFAIDAADGQLTPVQTIDAGGDKPWAVEITPTGRWLLVANQASNLVRLFAVDPASGQLTATSAVLAVGAPTSFAFASA